LLSCKCFREAIAIRKHLLQKNNIQGNTDKEKSYQLNKPINEKIFKGILILKPHN